MRPIERVKEKMRGAQKKALAASATKRLRMLEQWERWNQGAQGGAKRTSQERKKEERKIRGLIEQGADPWDEKSGVEGEASAVEGWLRRGKGDLALEAIESPRAQMASQGQKNDALIMAIEVGEIRAIRALLAIGADPKARGKWKGGEPAMLIAAKKNDWKALKELRRAGAEIEQADEQGTRPLMGAAMTGASQAMRWLLAAGASVSEMNDLGKSALAIAASRGDLRALRRLGRAGASLRESPQKGEEVLWAIRMGQERAACELMRLGLDEASWARLRPKVQAERPELIERLEASRAQEEAEQLRRLTPEKRPGSIKAKRM